MENENGGIDAFELRPSSTYLRLESRLRNGDRVHVDLPLHSVKDSWLAEIRRRLAKDLCYTEVRHELNLFDEGLLASDPAVTTQYDTVDDV